MLIEGTVFRGNSGLYEMRQDGDEHVYSARLRGNLKKELIYSTSGSRPQRVTQAKKRRSTDPIAVGDRVLFDSETQLIEQVLPRRTELARMSSGGKEQHVLVANLDIVFVCFAAASPQPDLWLLDRFLVLIEAVDLPAAIIINKIELVEDKAALHELFAPYASAGYPLYFISAKKDIGVGEIRQALDGRISAFTGPSGVGKSSLLNALKPGLSLKTGDIGTITFKGRHTTTAAELVAVDDHGTWIADTPGLRQVDFWEIGKEEIEWCFREFRPYLGLCQFTDCRHRQEPGCAVRAAVEDGLIDKRRYGSFLQISA